MKTLKEFINESNNIITKLSEELKKNIKDVHFNISDKMITFVGEKNENQTDFEANIIKAINKCGIDFKKNNLTTFRKINNDKCPVFYIGDKDYLESIKKDLEN